MELIDKKYKKTEVGIIPRDWDVKKIGEFTDATAGGTPSTFIAEYWGGEIKWMNSGELNLKIIKEVEGRITELGLNNSSTKIISKKCILIGLAGQGKTRGTVAINMIELCTNQSIAAIYPNKSFLPEYLYHNLDSRYDELRNLSTGEGGRGGLNLKIIKNLLIPIPIILEQTAIAKTLSDTDELITSLEKLIAKKKMLKQGAMQQLLTGKKRIEGFRDFWLVKSFIEVCDLFHGYQFRTNDFIEGLDGIKVVKITNIQDGRFNMKVFDCIANSRLNDFKEFIIKNGDILMSLTGNIGRVVRVSNILEPLLQNYRVGKFVPIGIDPLFLTYALASSQTTKQLELLSNQTSQANFGKQDFKKVKIKFPKSLVEQIQIAQILSDMDVEIKTLEKKLEKYNMLKQGMMQVLLTGKIRLI
jgi:type I restriction enzyme, S subunit